MIILLTTVITSWSQEYNKMIAKGSYSVQQIQASAESYFEANGKGKGSGHKQYKRWEYQALINMDENGFLKSPGFYFNELEKHNAILNNSRTNNRSSIANWEELGPVSYNQTSGWNPGVGRITSIAVDNSNTNHIIVGGETGGVWKSTDGGTTWNVLTDNLSNLNVYALAIHPTNSDVYYWGSDNGVMFKSIDGGSTWNLLANIGSGKVNKIIVDSDSTTKMYCTAQYGGIFKSTDSGQNWTKIHNYAITGYDVVIKPGTNGNTVYASGNKFYVSNDGGSTFNYISTAGFNGSPKMIGITGTTLDSNIVYVLEAASGGVFGGLYKSTNSGVSFTKIDHSGKNYFGYSEDPTDPSDATNGQAPRDMAIAINPSNSSDVHIGGVNTWRSLDGGANFSNTSQWIPNNPLYGYCHADIDLLMFVGSELFVASDGGIFKSNNPAAISDAFYTDLTSGLGIRQFYKIGISKTNPAVATGGAQDNGSSVMDINGNWTDWLGADGMEGFVDKDNKDIIYGTSQYGSLYKSVDGGATNITFSSPNNKYGEWVTPFEQDPIVQNVIYSAYDEVYKSVDGGYNWTSISQNFNRNMNHLKIANSDNNIMYASYSNSLFKTSDGGATDWKRLHGFYGSINSIAIHPTDTNLVAVATTSGNKVFISKNGGEDWTSYELNLPDFTARALVWSNSNEGLYLGMNYGIYYIDTITNSWQDFSNGLPNVAISELEINELEGKLYAATYGRGLWKTDIYSTHAGIDNKFELSPIAIYPNPATKEFYISWEEKDNVNIRIFNAQGKLLQFSKDISIFEPMTIDVSQFAAGIYFITINNHNGQTTKKIIVK